MMKTLLTEALLGLFAVPLIAAFLVVVVLFLHVVAISLPHLYPSHTATGIFAFADGTRERASDFPSKVHRRRQGHRGFPRLMCRCLGRRT